MDKINWKLVVKDTERMIEDLITALKPTITEKTNYTMLAYTYPPKVVLNVQAAGTSDLDEIYQKVSQAMTPVCEKWGIKCKSYWAKQVPPGWDRSKTYYLCLDYGKYKEEAK